MNEFFVKVDSKKLREIKAEEKSIWEEAKRFQNAYMVLQGKIRRSVSFPLDSEIRELQKRLRELKKQKRIATKKAYLANSELQNLKKENAQLWNRVQELSQKYRDEYNYQLRKQEEQQKGKEQEEQQKGKEQEEQQKGKEQAIDSRRTA